MKICSKCKIKYSATLKYFSLCKHTKDKLQSWCRVCAKIDHQRYKQTIKGKAAELKSYHKCRKTIDGYLQRIYNSVKQRCGNPVKRNICYASIQCKFQNLNDFRNYVKNNLGFDTFNKIKGLQIDRINNNGHYEPGNIRFVTAKVNSNNRKKIINNFNQRGQLEVHRSNSP